MKSFKLLAWVALFAAGTGTASAQNQLPVNFLGLTTLEIGPEALSGAPDDDLFTLNHHVRAPNANVTNSVSIAAAASTATLPTPRPQKVVRAGRDTSGFQGLTHYDQRFAGTGVYQNTQFSLEPPDQALCAGHGFVVEAINNAIAVFKADGDRVAGPEALSQFYHLQPEVIRSTPAVYGQFISDPRCYYDSATKRWFVTELEIDTDPATGADANHSSVLIAVSKTADPTGSYYLYSFDTTSGAGTDPLHPQCPCFGDQPLIGADAYGFYVSTNEFSIHGAAFNGAQIYALSKAKLESGTLGVVVHIDAGAIPTPPVDQAFGSLWYSVQPASSASAFAFPFDHDHAGTEYFLSALQFGYAPLDNRIAVWALTNTASLGTGTPNVQLLHTVISSESYGAVNAFGAAQRTGPTPLRDALGDTDAINQLNANDDRMNQVVYANGALWSGVNTNVSVGGHTRQGIAWFSVVPDLDGGKLNARLRDQGYVAVSGEDVLFPSIAVGKNGQAVMTFTLSGPDYYPSAAYAQIGDEAGSVHVIGAGAGPDDGFTGYAAYGGNGIARWGDYSAAVADEFGNIWMAAEYIGQQCTLATFTVDTTCGGTRSLLANWGTFIGRVPTGY
ncbi:MAG: hypothetical protein JWO52_3765 [Gammaproteobacteria bacterium]|jgi:hypothetical protein|nr:hypothetical protein [Gammaproteobacteria bacterium]